MSNAISALAAIPAGINAYSDAGAARKARMHSMGRAFLRRLAADLGLAKGEYDIRSNQGGIAVSGEVTLHADRLYVQLSEHCFGGRAGVSILFRTCNGRKDYSGGQNNNASMADIAERYPTFVGNCQRLIARTA